MFQNANGAGFNATAGGAQVQNNLDSLSSAAGSNLSASAANLGQLQNQQQSLAQTLLAQSQGQGPNPALAQLQQTTGQNVQNQAALMAGQRGAGANTGMIARQAAQQGAQIQQGATGQAATMRANQMLGAQSQLANVYGQIGQENLAQQNIYGSQQNMFQNALAGQNSALTGQNSNMAATNQRQAAINTQGQQNTVGGVMQGIGGVMGMLAKGGQVQRFADGGTPSLGVDTSIPKADFSNFSQQVQTNNPRSQVGQYLNQSSDNNQQPALTKGTSDMMTGAAKGISGMFGDNGSVDSDMLQGSSNLQDPALGSGTFGEAAAASPSLDLGSLTGAAAFGFGGSTDSSGSGDMMSTIAKLAPLLASKGGKVPALVSPGERYLPPREVAKVAEGKKEPIKAGEKIKGQAKVKGDSYANDNVHKTLEEGGIVLPRSVTQAKNAPEAARRFVADILKKKAKGIK